MNAYVHETIARQREAEIARTAHRPRAPRHDTGQPRAPRAPRRRRIRISWGRRQRPVRLEDRLHMA
jgi:hypothetical protein